MLFPKCQTCDTLRKPRIRCRIFFVVSQPGLAENPIEDRLLEKTAEQELEQLQQ